MCLLSFAVLYGRMTPLRVCGSLSKKPFPGLERALHPPETDCREGNVRSGDFLCFRKMGSPLLLRGLALFPAFFPVSEGIHGALGVGDHMVHQVEQGQHQHNGQGQKGRQGDQHGQA